MWRVSSGSSQDPHIKPPDQQARTEAADSPESSARRGSSLSRGRKQTPQALPGRGGQ